MDTCCVSRTSRPRPSALVTIEPTEPMPPPQIQGSFRIDDSMQDGEIFYSFDVHSYGAIVMTMATYRVMSRTVGCGSRLIDHCHDHGGRKQVQDAPRDP